MTRFILVLLIASALLCSLSLACDVGFVTTTVQASQSKLLENMLTLEIATYTCVRNGAVVNLRKTMTWYFPSSTSSITLPAIGERVDWVAYLNRMTTSFQTGNGYDTDTTSNVMQVVGAWPGSAVLSFAASASPIYLSNVEVVCPAGFAAVSVCTTTYVAPLVVSSSTMSAPPIEVSDTLSGATIGGIVALSILGALTVIAFVFLLVKWKPWQSKSKWFTPMSFDTANEREMLKRAVGPNDEY